MATFRNERQAAWVDFWAVKPSGDAATDYARGQRYADEVISMLERLASECSSNVCCSS
jgi:hypothetical protein